MPVLCGTDIVYIPKVKKLMRNENFLKKIFHKSELSPDADHLAGVIAAKEAFFKALGRMPMFREIEIIYETSGRPEIKLSPEFSHLRSCDVSISHDNEYAIAVVLVEK